LREKVLRFARKNDGVMVDDKSGDDDTREVRWSWRSDESGRGRSSQPLFSFNGGPPGLPMPGSASAYIHIYTVSQKRDLYTFAHNFSRC